MGRKKNDYLKTIVVLSLVVFLSWIFFCENAYAYEPKWMYFRQSSFAYLFPVINDDYAAAAYGKGEKVCITGEKITRDSETGERTIYYETDHFGRMLYIPESLLTGKKPKWSCRAEPEYALLRLDGRAKLYSQPYLKSSTVSCCEKELITLGKTKKWYKVFYQGEIFFIRKTDSHIKDVSDTSFPQICLSGIPLSEKNLLKSRVQYIWALLPSEIRRNIDEKLRTVNIVKNLPQIKFREMGAGGYACSNGEIYLKEDLNSRSSCTIEMCFLHELGHMLQYALHLNDNDENVVMPSVPETNHLNLREYYLQNDEYLAETFEIFIKNPRYLKEKELETYNYFYSLM